MTSSKYFRLLVGVLAVLMVMSMAVVAIAAEPIDFIFSINATAQVDVMTSDLRAALDEYYGNTNYTVEQLNTDLKVGTDLLDSVHVVPLDSEIEGLGFGTYADGSPNLLLGIGVHDEAVDGETLTVRIWDQNGWSYEQDINIAVGNLKVNTGAEFGGMISYMQTTSAPNTYLIAVEPGSNIDVKLDVTSLDGSETVLVEWYMMDTQTGDRTVLSPAGSTAQTFTFTNVEVGMEYGWIASVPSGSSVYQELFYIIEPEVTSGLVAQSSPQVTGTELIDYRQYEYYDDSYSFELCAEKDSSVTFALDYVANDGSGQVYIDWWTCDAYDEITAENKTIVKTKDTAQTYTFTNIDQDIIYGWDAYIENGQKVLTSTVFVYHPDEQKELYAICEEIPNEVTPALKQNPALDTPEEIASVISQLVKEQAAQEGLDVSTGGVKVYEAVLMVAKDNGYTWVEATEEDWPADGKLTVTMGYPEGCTKEHHIVVAHMFTKNVFGKKAGDVEYPVVRKYDDYFEFDVTGLSPISVAWSKNKVAATPNVVVTEAPAAPVKADIPKTGDNTPIALLIALMTISAAAVAILLKKRGTVKN